METSGADLACCTVYVGYCTVYVGYCTVYVGYCTVYVGYCTVYVGYCTIYVGYCTVYVGYCTVYVGYCTVYVGYCTVYVGYCTLYVGYCTVFWWNTTRWQLHAQLTVISKGYCSGGDYSVRSWNIMVELRRFALQTNLTNERRTKEIRSKECFGKHATCSGRTYGAFLQRKHFCNVGKFLWTTPHDALMILLLFGNWGQILLTELQLVRCTLLVTRMNMAEHESCTQYKSQPSYHIFYYWLTL